MTQTEVARSGHVVIGVDTHKHIHVAAVMDTISGILATLTIACQQRLNFDPLSSSES